MKARKAALLLACAPLALPGAAAAVDPIGASGGSYPSTPPVVERIACRSGCSGGGVAHVGSVLRVHGRSLEKVRSVVFLGGSGPRDDVPTTALLARPRWVDVRVPDGAPGGRVRLRNSDGAPSPPNAATFRLAPGPPPPKPRPVADRDTTDAIDAAVETPTVFFAGPRDATLRYVVTAPQPVEVAVELVHARGEPVARWTPGPVAPGVEHRIDWDGTVAGAAAPPGRYAFRIAPVGARAASDGPPPEVVDSFRFLDHKFPIRGPHDYGSAGAVFGAERAGHSHQGQDVFAPCGTPMVAARGGTVVFKASHARAGNYVVIRGDGNGVDYVYMHLAEPSPLARGARVRTGAAIGAVGDTGNAVGCHLHFEMWSPPGWYEGGRPFDPLAQLRAWDAVS